MSLNRIEKNFFDNYLATLDFSINVEVVEAGIAGNDAIAEGEGDLSLKYWRMAHLEFFKPFLKGLGINDINKEKVVTEFFEVVYK